MKGTYSCETLVDFERYTRRYIPADKTVLPGNLSKATDFERNLFLGED
jgi:hypothetical protein